MSMVHVESVGQNTLDHVNKVLGSFGNGSLATRAVAAAAKRAAQKGKTEAGRFAAAEYTIGKSGFMSHCKIKSSVSGGEGGATSVSIEFAGSVIPLLEFNTRYARGGRLTTTVKSGSSATLYHAFVAPMFGPAAVFEHINQTRGPVEQKFGPSTGHMMQNDVIIEQEDKVMMETFEQRIDHEISRILAGL